MSWTNSQNYYIQTIRAAAILTTSYVPATIIEGVQGTPTPNGVPGGFVGAQWDNQLVLYFFFTKGSLTSVNIKIEFSNDGTNWVQETYSPAPSAGVTSDVNVVHNWTADGNYRLALPIKDKMIRVSAEGVGTVTSSSLTILAILGTV